MGRRKLQKKLNKKRIIAKRKPIQRVQKKPTADQSTRMNEMLKVALARQLTHSLPLLSKLRLLIGETSDATATPVFDYHGSAILIMQHHYALSRYFHNYTNINKK